MKGSSKKSHELHFLGMNADLLDRFWGLGIENWKGYE